MIYALTVNKYKCVKYLEDYVGQIVLVTVQRSE